MYSLFKKANQKFRSGNYIEAIDLYKSASREYPAIERFVQFNLQLAQKRLYREKSKRLLCLSLDNQLYNWVSHKNLQSSAGNSRIVLGGIVLGYPEKNSELVPQRIAECAQLYEKIVQIQDLHGLRLIVGEELTRPSLGVYSPSIFIHAFGVEGIQIESVWYVNSRDLRLVFEKSLSFSLPRVFRAYQYDPAVGGGLVLVGEFILQGKDWQLTDLQLVNPYLPVLLTLATSDGYLTDAALIPYPSLLPGGIHEHECYIGNAALDPAALAQELLPEHLLALKHGWALGQLQVDIREALGSESILSNDVKEWLWSIFSLRIKPWRPPELSQALAEFWQQVFDTLPLMRTAEKFSDQTARERGGRTLLCPARAIPSLRAMTASRASGELEQFCGLGEFLLVQEGNPTQRWRLSWPEIALNAERALAQDGAVHVPMVLLGKNVVSQQNSRFFTGVSAILMGDTSATNALQLIMPIAPDFAEAAPQSAALPVVDVIVTVADLSAELFSAFLESLSLQYHINLRSVVVVLPFSAHQKKFDAHLQHYCAGRYLLLPTREGERYKQRVQRATAALKQLSDDSYMLFVNQPLVLHDPRTLARLVQTLSTPKVVTTSALLIGNNGKKSKPETVIRFGGIFPVQSQGNKEIRLREESLVMAMPKTTLPVASHSDAFFMMKTKEWKKSGGLADIKMEDESAVHEYSAKLAAINKQHLLVPHVTVELHGVAETSEASGTSWSLPENLNGHFLNAVCIEVLPS